MKTTAEPITLIAPYGGRLINLLAEPEQLPELLRRAGSLPRIQLSQRALCDLELLACGAFSPLDRFMGQRDYASVLERMRLAKGHLFPIPITLPAASASDLREGNEVALCDLTNKILAILEIEEIYEWDQRELAARALETNDSRHPLVAEMHRWGELNLSGRLTVLRLPHHADFKALRLSPTAVRARLGALGRRNIVAFQTRNPLHRAHEELTRHAIETHDAVLLLHPAVGMTQPGDVDHYSRVRTYQVLAQRYYQSDRILLALLPLAMRMAGPREALWHALVRRNYGANFLIVGRDHASPGNDSRGRPFYPLYAARDLVQQYSDELGVGVIPFEELVYLPDEDRYVAASNVPPETRTLSLSGSQARRDYLDRGEPLPAWYARPEVSRILADACQPRHKQGFCVWFTGLSCAGKSTVAELLTGLLLEHGRRVTLLDGDVVRTHLSRGLGFDKEDRDINIRRIGFVAAEVVRHGGVAICAAVSPYRGTRA